MTTTTINGFVTMKAWEVAAECTRILNARLKRIELHREKMITDCLSKAHQKFNWRRLRFERYFLTREQAIQELKVCREIECWSRWDLPAQEDRATAEAMAELLFAAETVDSITVMLVSTLNAARMNKTVSSEKSGEVH